MRTGRHQAPSRGRIAAPGGGQTLAGRASRALSWSFLSNALSRLGTVGIGIALARLLGPHAFGTYAVAYVALIAVLSFNELGVSLAIVRWQGEPSEITPTVTTISLAASAVIYAGCFLAAPAYAAAAGAPAAATVIRVLALNVIIDGAVSTPAALLQRHFSQKKKAITDQVNCWLGAILTILLAWHGEGAMSLAVGRLAGCLAGGILLVAFSPERLRLGFDPAKARALLRFGLPLGGASLVVFAVQNVDQLVVGHLLGATALGCYVLAFNLSGWPGTIFSMPVRTVAPAVFSRLQHDRNAMSSGFLSVAGVLSGVAFPVCALLSGSAVPLIAFVYGAHWLPATRALIWLGLLAGLRIFFELVYDFFVVLARSRVVLTVQVVWLVVLVPALIIGCREFGIFGAALAGVVVAGVVVLPWYLAELRSVGIEPRALAGRVWLPLAGAALAGLAAAAVRRVAPDDLTALAVSGVITLAIMAALVYRMRGVLAFLRPASPQPGDETVPAAPPDPEDGAETLTMLLRLPGPQPVPDAGTDITGPLPLCRDRYPMAALPLYLATVRALGWDPSPSAGRADDTIPPRPAAQRPVADETVPGLPAVVTSGPVGARSGGGASSA